MNENEQTLSFVMYESFFEAADELQLDYTSLGEFVARLRDYVIYGEEHRSEDGKVNALLALAKPLVKASANRHKNAVKGGDHGNKGADYGHLGGRPRTGETKEEANERRRKERELKEQEPVQEPQPVAKPQPAVETRENPKINPNENPENPLNVNDKLNEKFNVNENYNDNLKDNVEKYEEKKSIDYYIELFLNYNYHFNYNLLINEKDLFYEKYKYPVDKLRENIVKGTGIPISVEATLCYLLEYLQLTRGLQ